MESTTDPFVRVSAREGGNRIDGVPRLELGRSPSPVRGPGPEPGYAKWEWDGKALTVANCRYGLRPLYYFKGPNEICVSTSPLRLLREGASAALDDGAMAVFLRLGFFIGDDTPFQAIRVIPPSAQFRWCEGRLEITSEQPQTRTQTISRDRALDGFIDLVQTAIERRPPRDAFVHPLSGGKDSRHILLALLKAGYRPETCVTARHFPPRTNSDETIARQLASELKLRHVVVAQSRSRVKAEARKNHLTGFCSLEHAWALPLAGWLTERTCTLYDGMAGDILAGSSRQDPETTRLAADGNFDTVAEKLLEKFSGASASKEGGLHCLLGNDLFNRWNRDLARERLVRELSRFADDPAPLRSFFFWNRVRRAISLYTFRVLPSSLDIVCPFLDTDVFDFLTSLPPELVIGREFHREAIYRKHPSLSHVPFEDTRAVFSSTYVRRMARELMWRGLRHWNSEMVDCRSFVPRMARAVVDGTERTLVWTKPLVAAYLLDLEDAIRRTAGAAGVPDRLRQP